jgi:uncharacterized protein YlxW (UPF0749 family)
MTMADDERASFPAEEPEERSVAPASGEAGIDERSHDEPSSDAPADDDPNDEPVNEAPEGTPIADAPHDGDGTQQRRRLTGWSALGSALHPRATRAQVLAGVLCAVLGFAVVVQLRQADDASLSGLRTDELVRLLDETTTSADQLSREAASLQAERDQLESGSSTRQAAIDAARRSAAMQGILSGRLPAEGPGVRISLQDPNGTIRPVTMLNMLEELRNAGAEAIQVGDERVTASSAFTGAPGGIQLDGVTLKAPYVWLVIGDPDTIQTALQIPGGAMAYVRNDGGTGDVAKVQHVEVNALRELPDPKYATLAPVPGS